LLPLAEETPHLMESKHLPSESDHDHDAALTTDAADCGSRSGRHAPCAGCLKRPDDHP
jgi:hypothetical protein